MTPAQLQALKAAILADPVLAAQPMTSAGALVIKDAMNQLTSPPFYVYRTSVSRIEIQDNVGTGGAGGSASEWDWTVYKNQSPSEQGAWRDMFIGDGANFAKVKLREGIAKIFTGSAAANAMRDHILSFGRRVAKRGETLPTGGIGAGTIASPGTMLFEGDVTSDDVQQARELP